MMWTPLCVVWARSVARLNRRAAAAERRALVLQMQRDDALELVADLNDDVETLRQERDGWRRRAEALSEALDPLFVHQVWGVISTIEALDECEERRVG